MREGRYKETAGRRGVRGIRYKKTGSAPFSLRKKATGRKNQRGYNGAGLGRVQQSGAREGKTERG